MVNPQEKFEKILKDIRLMPNTTRTAMPQMPPQYKQILDQYTKQVSYSLPDKKELEEFVKDILKNNDAMLTSLSGLPRDPTVTIQIMTGQEWIINLFNDLESKMESMIISKATQYFQERTAKKWQNSSFLEKVGMVKNRLKQAKKNLGAAVEMVMVLPELQQYVMGQYDNLGKQKINHKVLRILASNITRISNEACLPKEYMMASVSFHEDTHNRQFTNYPQLEKKLNGIVDEMIVAKMCEEKGGVDGLTAEEAHKITENRENEIEALMSVVEGHAVFFEEMISQSIIPYYPQMEALMDIWKQKRREKIEKRKHYPESLKKKSEQYSNGLVFVAEVYKAHKENTSKVVFENLPSIEELKNPQLYLAKH